VALVRRRVMVDKRKEEDDFTASPSAAARPAAQTFNRGQVPPLAGTDDPFVDDMTEVANETIFDGNSQINSPQEVADDQGSPGTSR
jgi:hypothetical protein